MCVLKDLETITGIDLEVLERLGEDPMRILKNSSIRELTVLLGSEKRATKLFLLKNIVDKLYLNKKKEKLLITSPRMVYEYLKPMAYYDVEVMHIIYLDNKNQVVGEEDLCKGTVNATLVNPREVFIKALSNKAVQILLAHNHPSNISDASREDLLVTERLKQVGDLVGISLLDHMIICKDNYVSLKEDGHLKS